jgi:hypothetical protein
MSGTPAPPPPITTAEQAVQALLRERSFHKHWRNAAAVSGLNLAIDVLRRKMGVAPPCAAGDGEQPAAAPPAP